MLHNWSMAKSKCLKSSRCQLFCTYMSAPYEITNRSPFFGPKIKPPTSSPSKNDIFPFLWLGNIFSSITCLCFFPALKNRFNLFTVHIPLYFHGILFLNYVPFLSSPFSYFSLQPHQTIFSPPGVVWAAYLLVQLQNSLLRKQNYNFRWSFKRWLLYNSYVMVWSWSWYFPLSMIEKYFLLNHIFMLCSGLKK